MKNPFESGDVRVTSPYGMRGDAFHKGIDLVGTSSTRLVAVEDATVAVSTIVTDRQNKTWEWGNYVRLDLADGRRLYYCHLAQRLVRAGEKVKKGQVIGIMGATGNAVGAHLHWELRPKGFSLESLDITAYSGIPNARGVYDGENDEPLSEAEVVQSFAVGEKVRIKQHARYTNGVSVPSEYVGGEYTVMQVLTGRVLIKELYSWVENRYVEKAQNTPAVQAD
ncbi:MAG: M23 family metallopeptidase, partial [Clostridia bacterium]|nr:M23 family metallopeptidase [Clostridia bacterium]